MPHLSLNSTDGTLSHNSLPHVHITVLLSSVQYSLKLIQKHYLPRRFDLLSDVFVRRSWYSVLWRRNVTIDCCQMNLFFLKNNVFISVHSDAVYCWNVRSIKVSSPPTCTQLSAVTKNAAGDRAVTQDVNKQSSVSAADTDALSRSAPSSSWSRDWSNNTCEYGW